MDTSVAVKEVTAALLRTGARKVTKFVSPLRTVKVSRMFRANKRNSRETLIVSFGTPNYREKQFIKLLKTARVSFPVRNVQLKFYSKRNGGN